MYGHYYKIFKGTGSVPTKVTVVGIEGDTVTFVRGHITKGDFEERSEDLDEAIKLFCLTKMKCNKEKVLTSLTPKQQRLLEKEDAEIERMIMQENYALEKFKNGGNETMTGTVKWFNTQKGYGFIVGDDGTDYFVHYSNIKVSEFRHLDAGDHVEFDVETNDKGIQAINVVPVLTMSMIKERAAEELAVETFIVNYDKTNNTRIWHQLNNENDLYYKNLYPVTEKQYDRLTELQNESVFPLSEDLIMQVINAVEYKQDGWNPAHYRRGMCGIGYSGMAVGAEGYYEKSYTKWKDMMQRCHDKEVHKKYKPEYADKCVCEEWQNYANFKLWYDEHHVFGNRIDLDKDILKPGNKEYSPETCVLIEHYINTIFERHASDNIYENEDGKYFIGSNRKKVYETYDEVFEFACNKKKERIEKVAEKNLGRIPKCAYDAMLRYDVEALIRRDVIAA